MEFMSKRVNYFIAVAQEGSITKAADRLCITPSPLSKRIKEMEENLNITLFERTNQGLSLTKEGQHLYSNVIVHYEELNRIKDSHKEKNHIQVGIYGPVPTHVNTVIDYLLMKNPAMTINLVRLMPTDGISRNELNRLYLLFSIEPLELSPFTQHLCAEEQLLLLHQARQSSESYRALPWVQSNYVSETQIFKHYHAQLQLQGFSRDVMNIDNLQLRLNFIRQGKAVAFILESMRSVINFDEYECNSLCLPNTNLIHHIYSNVAQLNDSQQLIAHMAKRGAQQWSHSASMSV
ncbi:LysR family transcriptional regulator [Serratia marcescens]|nr:LysR family transcriptional regulator [Serratia marcescens]